MPSTRSMAHKGEQLWHVDALDLLRRRGHYADQKLSRSQLWDQVLAVCTEEEIEDVRRRGEAARSPGGKRWVYA